MIRVQVSCIAIRDNKVALIKKITKDSGVVYNRLISPGGHVEQRESLEEACIREMREETGLQVSGLSIVSVVSFISHVSDYHSVCFFFRADRVDGELQTSEPEKMEAHWVDLADVPTHELIIDYDRTLIDHAAQGTGLLNARVEWHDIVTKQHTFTMVPASNASNEVS